MENDDLVTTRAGAQLVHDVIEALLRFSARACAEREDALNASEILDAALCGVVTFFSARVKEDAPDGAAICALRACLENYRDVPAARESARKLVQLVADEIGCVEEVVPEVRH